VWVCGFKVGGQEICPLVLTCGIFDQILTDFEDHVGSTRPMCVLAERVAGKEAGIGCIVAHRAGQSVAEPRDQRVRDLSVMCGQHPDFPWSRSASHELRCKAVDGQKRDIAPCSQSCDGVMVGLIERGDPVRALAGVDSAIARDDRPVLELRDQRGIVRPPVWINHQS
jgi:hypothetical protein